MNDDINKIASTHLGRTSDGQTMAAYVTPDVADASLLVPIPRLLNRTQYDIDEYDLPFVGYDVWHGYEVSFLNKIGMPVNCVLKMVYPSYSQFIVESKSLKLYLNSFNMHRFESLDPDDVIAEAGKMMRCDLSKTVGAAVFLTLHDASKDHDVRSLTEADRWISLETVFKHWYLDSDAKPFEDFKENPELLEGRNTPGLGDQMFYSSSSLRSNCRVTNQPDWGDVYIYMKAGDINEIVTPGSLLRYIVSMRGENHFHEEICECVFKRLNDRFKPESLLVACLYTRRGGIDINPIRSIHEHDIKHFFNNLILSECWTERTIRQ